MGRDTVGGNTEDIVRNAVWYAARGVVWDAAWYAAGRAVEGGVWDSISVGGVASRAVSRALRFNVRDVDPCWRE